jgi:hypothetical protein
VGGADSTHWTVRNACEISSQNLKGKDHRETWAKIFGSFCYCLKQIDAYNIHPTQSNLSYSANGQC